MTWKISVKLILFTTKFRCLEDRRRLPSRVCMHKCQPPHNNYYTLASNQSRHGEERQVDKRTPYTKWHNGASSMSCALPKHIWEIRMFLSDVCPAFWPTSRTHLANQEPSLKHNWQSMTALQNVRRHTHPTTCITTVRADLLVLKLSPGSTQRHNCSYDAVECTMTNAIHATQTFLQEKNTL